MSKVLVAEATQAGRGLWTLDFGLWTFDLFPHCVNEIRQHSIRGAL